MLPNRELNQLKIYHEADKTVFLLAILRNKQLGIAQATAREQAETRALMAIIANHLMTNYHAWQKLEAEHYLNFAQRILTDLQPKFKIALRSAIKHGKFTNKDAFKLLVKTQLQPIFKNYCAKMNAYSDAKKSLQLGSLRYTFKYDAHEERQLLDDYVKQLLSKNNSKLGSTELDLEIILDLTLNRVFSFKPHEVMTYFNNLFTHYSKRQTQVNSNLNDNELPEESNNLNVLHNAYATFRSTTNLFVQNQLNKVRNSRPQFTDNLLLELYRHVFKVFFLDRFHTIYTYNLLCELYLQQAARPDQHEQIFEYLQNVYIPQANRQYIDLPEKKISLANIMTTIDNAIATGFPTASEMLVTSDTILNSRKVIPIAEIPTYHFIVNPEESYVAEELLYTTSSLPVLASNINSLRLLDDMMLHEVIDTQAAEILSPTLLHAIHKTNKATLLCREQFGTLSTDPNVAVIPGDHAKAKAVFEVALNNADSVEKTAALAAVSKPYLNRHRHPTRDATLGPENTNTWKGAFFQARAKAIDQLREVANDKSPATLTYLKFWQQDDIIAKQRATRKIFKTKKTNAEKTVQRLIDDVISSIKPRP